MSLLADLKLSYEMLADDPVEVSIHYGKSLLDVASAQMITTQKVVAQELIGIANQPISLSTRVVRRFADTVDRGRFVQSYSARTSPTYAKRQIVGVV